MIIRLLPGRYCLLCCLIPRSFSNNIILGRDQDDEAQFMAPVLAGDLPTAQCREVNAHSPLAGTAVHNASLPYQNMLAWGEAGYGSGGTKNGRFVPLTLLFQPLPIEACEVPGVDSQAVLRIIQS